jgi:membrane protein YdbS with pleckstrin-like domain
MNKTPEWLIVNWGILLFAVIVAVVGYFFAKDLDALAAGFLMSVIVAVIALLKAKPES